MRHSKHTDTLRRRVELALRGGCGDDVPFTMYEGMIPQCQAERELRNRGLCIVNRQNVFKTRRPNVNVQREIVLESGKQMTRTHYETPVGTVSTLTERAGFTTWTHEKMFKDPDDYKVLLFLITDEVFEANYEAFAQAERVRRRRHFSGRIRAGAAAESNLRQFHEDGNVLHGVDGSVRTRFSSYTTPS